MASNMILHLIVSLLPFVSQETLRKLMLGSLVVFVEPGSTTQLGFFFVVCLLALVAHLHVKPFKANLDNTLQGNALFAIVVTVFFAIFKMGNYFFISLFRCRFLPSSHYFAVFFFYFTADRNAATTAEDDSQMTSFMYIVLILNIVVVITTIGSVLLLTRKIRILVPKIMQSVKASAVRRRSSISGGLAPNQADAALLAERRASTVSTTKQAKPLGGEEQLQ